MYITKEFKVAKNLKKERIGSPERCSHELQGYPDDVHVIIYITVTN